MSRFCVLALASMIVACDSAPNELTRPPRDPALYAHPKDDALRIDHLQVKATHNSYHIAPSEKTIPDWSYTHAPLDVQLDEQGVRGVELDLHWDGQGEIRVLHVPLLDPKTTSPINQVRIVDTVIDRIRNLNRRPVAVTAV